jgi:ABC-type lipopolysaccharide export system ATPase subunit
MIDPDQYDGFATPEELNLSPEEIEKLRQNKNYLTAQGKQKIKRLNAQRQSRKIIEATMPYTLRPKSGDRKKVIAAALEFIIEEYGFIPWDFGYNDIEFIDVKDIRDLIEELRDTGTVGKPSQGHCRKDLDAL